MTNSPQHRSAVAKKLLEFAPPLIRDSLLDDADFRDEFGIERERLLAFEDAGPSLDRSELYDAIRVTLSGKSGQRVTDPVGRDWEVVMEQDENQSAILSLIRDDQQITLIPHTTLSPNRDVRLHSVEKIADDFNLPTSSRIKWREIVLSRSLDNEEVDELYNDFCDTPVDVKRSIYLSFRNRKVSVSSLVPCSLQYYERLVGVYDGSASIADYAVGAGRQFFEQLSSWRPYDGFLFCLLLSSHSSLTAEISVERLDSEDLLGAFNSLEKCGDSLSQLGAIEVGLRVLPDRPEIRPVLGRLLKQIRDDDAETSTSGFKLLSELFLLVDGELCRTRLFGEQPPFYRRMAALSQATMICRQFKNDSNAIDSFCRWASARGRGGYHYSQSLADMRLEPRWCPEFSAPRQMRASFLGRIVSAAMKYEENIRGTELHDLIRGTDSHSLEEEIEFPGAYFPGPLEGSEGLSGSLPDFISEAIECQLKADEVGVASFVGLVNFAPLCRVESNLLELASEALKRGKYRFADIESRSQLSSALNGLALVSAVTRNSALADELRILMRSYMRDAQYPITIEEILRNCLVAAASRADTEDWKVFVGECLTELAFGELKDHDRDVLHTRLQYLCHAVPELWAFCSQADAALEALRGY